MTKRKKTPTKPRKRHASFSRDALAEKLNVDVRTITRRTKFLGITPNPRQPGARVTYDLTPDQLKQLRQPLARGNGSGVMDSDLKQAKLLEEIEHLRLKNKRIRSESTPNVVMAEFLLAAKDAIPDLIEQHLDKYADDAAGKEPAEIRGIGKQANDDIRRGIDAFLCGWLPAFDGE